MVSAERKAGCNFLPKAPSFKLSKRCLGNKTPESVIRYLRSKHSKQLFRTLNEVMMSSMRSSGGQTKGGKVGKHKLP